MIVACACIILAGILFLALRFSLFLPEVRGLPVLLYHKVSDHIDDSITVSPAMLERHLRHLCENGYSTISASQLLKALETGSPLPRKPVLITFDDGYVNNLEHAAPLLEKYRCKAVFFIPSAGMGKTNWWDRVPEPLMDSSQLKGLDPNLFEIGLHSFDHKHYGKLNGDQFSDDLRQCIDGLRSSGIGFVPVFAYPYGGRPKEKRRYRRMMDAFREANVKAAFRIGNRVNKLPIKNVFEIKRISICGTDSMWTFRTKLTKGRVKQV
jgi:hypothetical protein